MSTQSWIHECGVDECPAYIAGFSKIPRAAITPDTVELSEEMKHTTHNFSFTINSSHGHHLVDVLLTFDVAVGNHWYLYTLLNLFNNTSCPHLSHILPLSETLLF